MSGGSLKTKAGNSLFTQFSNIEDQIGGYSANASFSAPDVWGIISPLSSTDASSTIATDSSGHCLNQTTSAIVDSVALLSRSIDYSFGIQIHHVEKFKLDQIDDLRLWYGFTTSTSTMLTGDSSNNSFGLHYSTVRGDTTFQFISQGTVQEVVDSGITVTTDPFIIETIYIPDSSITFNLYNSVGVLLASESITTNLPSSSIGGEFNGGISAQTTSAKTVGQYKGDFIFKPLT